MATKDDSSLKIGIGLDTSKLQAEARQAERTLKDAVDGVTDAVEQQGKAAEQTGQAHTAAAQAATSAHLTAGAAAKSTTEVMVQQMKNAQHASSMVAEQAEESSINVVSSMDKIGREGKSSIDTLRHGIGQGTQAVGGFTKALNIANGVMGVLSKTFAVVGLINQVATSLKLIADWYADITKKAENAGRKVRETWAAQREEARRLREQNAALDALNAQIEAHDKILAKMREEASHEAKMRGMRARAAGNMDEAEKATLDGMLARNEISEAEHIDRTRAIDDRATERRQADEMAAPLSDLATATEALNQKQTEYTSAIEALNALVQQGQQLGLANEGGVNTNYMEQASARWAELQQFIDDNGGDRGRWAGNLLKGSIHERDRLAKAIYDAADALNVKKTDDKGEKLSIQDLATKVQEEWERQRKARNEAIAQAHGGVDAANTDVRHAQDVVDAKQGEHDAENAATAAARQQQDLTLAWSANRAATEANTEAQRAATDAEREAQREELTQRHDAATDAAEQARTNFRTSWEMEQERATAEQAAAMAAINRLLTRGEKEPRALEQLLAMLSGQEVTLTEDEARRYGTDFQLAKNGALTVEQQAAISTVVQQLMTALQAEAEAKRVGEEVDAFNAQDAATARVARDAEVERLRAEAEEARRRADEATARLQRYEPAPAPSGQPAAPAPPPSALPAVPEPAPMPPVNEALRAAGDVVAQHNDLANAVMGAMGQFNATTSAAVAAIGTQRGQLAKLTAESNAMQQQLANLARANV